MPYYVESKEEKDLDWFLQNVIQQGIGKIINNDAGYLAFALIAQSIELMGAMLDEEEFEKSGLAEERFAKAITTLFKPTDALYFEYNKKGSEYYLWESLRCGMAHILRPKPRILFTGRSEATKNEWKHLRKVEIEDNDTGVSTDYLLLVVEDFYDHLVEACRRLNNLLRNKTHPKLRRGFITIRKTVSSHGLAMHSTSGCSYPCAGQSFSYVTGVSSNTVAKN